MPNIFDEVFKPDSAPSSTNILPDKSRVTEGPFGGVLGFL